MIFRFNIFNTYGSQRECFLIDVVSEANLDAFIQKIESYDIKGLESFLQAQMIQERIADANSEPPDWRLK